MQQPNLLDFHDHLRTLQLAPRSADEYVRWARRLVRWCEQWSTTPAEATVGCIATWGDTLPASRASRKNAAVATRHLLEWCGRHDRAWRAIYVPRKPHNDPRPLEPDTAALLLEAAVMHGGRQGLAVLIGLHTGARREEIARMRWDGMDLDRGRIRFRRVKGNPPADLAMHPVVADALERHPRTGLFLFPGNNGRPHVAPATIWQWVRKVGRAAGIEVATHELRHTFITEVNDLTDNLRLAQHVAGHADPAQTARYTRVRRQKADDAVLQVTYRRDGASSSTIRLHVTGGRGGPQQ